MPSRAEQIIQSIEALLTVPEMDSVPAAHVYRDLDEAIDKSISCAIAIESGNETTPEPFSTSQVKRRLAVRVSAIAKGRGASSLVDAPMLEAYGRIVADETLGGLVTEIEEGEVEREHMRLEKPVARVSRTYYLTYLTKYFSLEN